MTSPQQIEILDIRHFGSQQLRALLEQEAGQWQSRLRWDYRSSSDLLLQYLESRILPGFVALDRGRVCGYTFCVYEGHKAVIGDLYTERENPAPLAVSQTLIRHLLETLEASPSVTRIEAQLLLFDAGVLRPMFSNLGRRQPYFTAYPRLFLEHLLPPQSPPPDHLPPGFELCPWQPSFYNPAAELIHAAYAGHVDATINDQYRTLAGSQRFLHNVVRFPGCGNFDPESSWAIRFRGSSALAAVILCSRVAPDTAHITQLCVAPRFRGRRLGRLLLASCMTHLRSRRYCAITLTVSEANTAAVNLYQAAAFGVRHRFDALVLDKKPHRLRLL